MSHNFNLYYLKHSKYHSTTCQLASEKATLDVLTWSGNVFFKKTLCILPKALD